METDIQVRRAVDADLPMLVAALGQADLFADYLRRQAAGSGDLLVALAGGRPVGDVYLWRERAYHPVVAEHLPGLPILTHAEVLPGHQGRGVGTKLMRAAERLAYSYGHDRLAVGVGEGNPRARRLYERLGFTDWGHGTVDLSWQHDGVRVTEACGWLVKPLGSEVPDPEAWDAWHPEEIVERLGGYPGPWCVAAGWAIDLYLGRETREHSDLEIAIPRAEFPRLRPWLEDEHTLCAIRAGRIYRMGPLDVPPPHPYHQVWLLDEAAGAYRMDVFLEPGDAGTWISHRDPRIRVPYADAVARTPAGIPYLRPEIVLVTKAKNDREKDLADLENVWPTLDGRARRWVRESVALLHPEHHWLDRLSG